jgi:hypothetical protein
MESTPTIRKQPADTVRYGSDISTRGGYVWCAYSGDKLVTVARTKERGQAQVPASVVGEIKIEAVVVMTQIKSEGMWDGGEVNLER